MPNLVSATGSQICRTVYSCAAPRKLIADRNSCRVSNLFRKAPIIRLVTIVTPDLWTPLVVMHWCAASITTATPYGLSTVSYTHLRAHETRHELVCRLLLEKKKESI